MSKKKKKRTAGDVIRTLILILALGVFLFSAVNLVQIFLEYKQGTDEYDRMREFVTEEVEKQPQEEETEARGRKLRKKSHRHPRWIGRDFRPLIRILLHGFKSKVPISVIQW